MNEPQVGVLESNGTMTNFSRGDLYNTGALAYAPSQRHRERDSSSLHNSHGSITVRPYSETQNEQDQLLSRTSKDHCQGYGI